MICTISRSPLLSFIFNLSVWKNNQKSVCGMVGCEQDECCHFVNLDFSLISNVLEFIVVP